MKLLAIDGGNTHTHFGLFDQKTLKKKWRTKSTSQDLQKILPQMPHDVDGICISSVVPSLKTSLQKFSKKWGLRPLFIRANGRFPFRIQVDQPKKVGVDRLVNVAAAFHRWKCTLIVIDLGTATTLDVITKKGNYLGGAILPGPGLMSQSLLEKCALLPLVPLKKPKKSIGKNTKTAIQSGIFLGYASLIEGLIQRMTKEIRQKPFVVATGGLAPLLAPAIKGIHKVDVDLTLKGLQILADFLR